MCDFHSICVGTDAAAADAYAADAAAAYARYLFIGMAVDALKEALKIK